MTEEWEWKEMEREWEEAEQRTVEPPQGEAALELSGPCDWGSLN